jgi:serine/threonine protein phosphatase PrpC
MKLNVIKKSRFDLHGYKKQPEIYLIRDALKSVCEKMQKDIEGICERMRNEMSGSTIVSVFLYGNILLALNIGDSKGLMISVKNQSVVVSQLTKDHKPDIE